MSDEPPELMEALADADADIERARRWASVFAARFPEIVEAYLVGSRVDGRAGSESDYDVILLVETGGALSLSNFETIPSDEKAWGWLLPADSARLGFAPGTPCDIMLVDACSKEFEQDGFAFSESDPHVLLWTRVP